MKLKTIAALFKRNKRLTIYTTENGEQWVCNGVAMYSMRGMPGMTPEAILRIFDIPPDKHSDWICNEGEMPTVINCADNVRGEINIEPMKINIEWLGNTYWLFSDGMRIYSFNEDYIKPLLDESEYLTFYKRETRNGGFMLACKIGIELKAIIAPVFLHEEEKFTDEIKSIAKLYSFMEEFETVVNAANEIYGDADNLSSGAEFDSTDAADEQMDFTDVMLEK